MKIVRFLSFALSLSQVTAVAVRGSKDKESVSFQRSTKGLMGGKMGGPSSSGSSGGGGTCNIEGYNPLCAICDQCNKNRPLYLTFQYKATGLNSEYQPEDKATCRASAYPASTTIIARSSKDANEVYFQGIVSDGDVFTIRAPTDGKFQAETDFVIAGWGGGIEDDADVCFIHTSCSVPLVQGDQIGPLIVMVGTGCDEPASAPPTIPPTNPPTIPPTNPPTIPATGLPTNPPTEKPTDAPACISTSKVSYECGEDITVSWDLGFPENAEGEKGPLVDDWIGIYPCITGTEYQVGSGLDMTVATVGYKHSESWLWTCAEFGDNFLSCNGVAKSQGSLTFQSPMPAYNGVGPHKWPVAPYHTIGRTNVQKDNNEPNTSEINTCFKAVLLRFDGPSVPPYVELCESAEFIITAGASADCQVRDSSPSAPLLPLGL